MPFSRLTRATAPPFGTAVHVAIEDGRAYVRTYGKAWKWKRVRHTPECELAPCTLRGRRTGADACSFAFDDAPRSWNETDWPRGLRERIEPSAEYLSELLAWFDRASSGWLDAIRDDVDLDELRPVHWGETWPLRDIVAYVAAHWAYHAGEINLILAVRRGEAWEPDEHVE